MGPIPLDDRGRLTLPEDLRERYGDQYYAVDIEDGIKLFPIAEDPLDALREEFADIEKRGDRLRDESRAAFLDDAGE